MHPPLHIIKHPHCKEAIENLRRCHKENPNARFFGACNELKFALDSCLREEKKINRGKNREKAMREKESMKDMKVLFEDIKRQ